MSMIVMRDVVKEYPSRDRREAPLRALNGVSLTVERGSIFGIVGYSGAGKSTLLRLMNALELATSGEIEVDGKNLVGERESALRVIRSQIGMIFQHSNLFNSRTVAGNVEFSLKIAGVDASTRSARVAELLEFVGLGDRARAYPDQLSGGQRQRVGIARALATSPHLLLADEATSALDPQTTTEVLDLLERVNRELGVTIVLITHEMDVIKRLATDVAVMEQGDIVEQGPVYDLFAHPQHPATRRFVSTVVSTVPSGDALADLQARHPGTLATISTYDDGASSADVLGRLVRAGVEADVVAGGMQQVAGRTFGHLTYALRGSAEAVDAALASVGTVAEVTRLDAPAAAPADPSASIAEGTRA